MTDSAPTTTAPDVPESAQYIQDLLAIKASSPLKNWVFLIGRLYKSFRVLIFLILGVLALRRFMSVPLNGWDLAISLMLFMPLLVFFILPKVAAYSQNEIMDEYFRGNFDNVLDLCDKYIKTAAAYRTPEEIATLTTEYRAKCLAKKGKLNEALALVEMFGMTFRSVPASKFLHIKATVYATANEFEKAVECYKTLTEKEPENTIGWLGMVDPLALYLNRPVEARACFERARALPLSPETQSSIGYLEAMVLLSEENYAAAKVKFEEQLPAMEAIAQISPIGEGWRAMMLAQLAIACARLGEMDAARAHFEIARPMLEVQKIDILLERCKRELQIV